MTGKPWTDYECQLLEQFEAIHFSHYSIVEGVVREGETFKHRPEIAVNIMKLYHKKCQPTSVTAVSVEGVKGRTPQLQHVPEGVDVVPMNQRKQGQQQQVAQQINAAALPPPTPHHTATQQQQQQQQQQQTVPGQQVSSSGQQVVTAPSQQSSFNTLGHGN